MLSYSIDSRHQVFLKRKGAGPEHEKTIYIGHIIFLFVFIPNMILSEAWILIELVKLEGMDWQALTMYVISAWILLGAASLVKFEATPTGPLRRLPFVGACVRLCGTLLLVLLFAGLITKLV